jgi:serine/threonine-protein kinase
VLYELLTDQKPFRGNTLSDITTAVIEHEPPPANVVNKDAPKALAEIAARAMEKDPEHRFRSARALSRELRHWLEEHGQANDGASDGKATKMRALWAGVATAALVLGAAAWWASGPHRSDTTAEVAAAPAAATDAPAADAASAAAAPAVPAAQPSVVELPAADPAGPTGATPTPAPAKDAASVTAAKPAKEAVKETPMERKARLAREREARNAAAPLASGSIRLAVSPWGQVEVDGTPVGTAPPLNEITLSEGRHQITIRNEDFPPYSASVNVTPGTPVTLKHKFGS